MEPQGKAAVPGRLSSRPSHESPDVGPSRRRTRRTTQPLVASAMTLGLFLFVATLYLVSLRVSIGPLPATPADLEARDNLYFAIHGFFLLVALTSGFSLGKWINGLGFAFAVLLLALTSAFMVAVQVGSYELACGGHNDLVRHWQC